MLISLNIQHFNILKLLRHDSKRKFNFLLKASQNYIFVFIIFFSDFGIFFMLIHITYSEDIKIYINKSFPILCMLFFQIRIITLTIRTKSETNVLESHSSVLNVFQLSMLNKNKLLFVILLYFNFAFRHLNNIFKIKLQWISFQYMLKLFWK